MPQIKYLRQEEVEALFANITDKRDRALFAAIYHYGLRVSEATLLLVSDVDFCHQTLFIRRLKNGRGGQRPLLTNTATLLRQYLCVRQPTGDALFTGRQGTLTPQRIQQLFKEYAHNAELSDYSVHSLRHSIATHLLEAGFDIADVQDHLGHVNIQSTLIYAQMTDKRRVAFFEQLEKSRGIVTF